MTMRAALTVAAIALIVLAPLVIRPVALAQANSEIKVVLLSVDGLRRDLLEKFVDRGDLPNIGRLMDEGCTGVLTGVYPANSYASQASLFTGVYPKIHGVLGSSYHAPGTPVGSRTPSVNSSSILDSAETFWTTADKNGLNVTLANVPFSWPPRINGTVVDRVHVLASSVLYTTRELSAGETRIELIDADLAAWGYTLRDSMEPKPREARLTVDGSNVTLYLLIFDSKLQGIYDAAYVSTSRSISDTVGLLTEGSAWTNPVRVRIGNDVGILKLKLLEVSPKGSNLTVYKTETTGLGNFTQPTGLASALLESGVFPLASADWAGFSRGWFGEEVFMETLEMAADWYANVTVFCSTNVGWEVFAASFPVVEEAQRAFLGYVTSGHPRYQAAKEGRYLALIERAYVRLDAVVGSCLSRLDGRTLLVLASSGGSTPVDRVFHVNRWLRDRGWLTMTAEGSVEWNSTKVFYAGDGQLFVNLKGRETEGIVNSSEYNPLVSSVLSGLAAATDGTRAPAALAVPRASMELLGLGGERAGDIAIVPASGYTLSGALGGNETSPFENTPSYLTGESGLDPVEVKAEGFIGVTGVYVMKGDLGKASVLDVAPSLLAVLNTVTTKLYDGQPISSAFTVRIGGFAVLERGRIGAAYIEGLQKKLGDLESTVSQVKADAAIYPFIIGLISVAIGLVIGSAIGRRRAP